VEALIYILHTVTHTAPCDTSFKARRIEMSLLTYLLTYPASNNTSVCDRGRTRLGQSLRLCAILLDKMADLDILDNVYNWLVSYFSGHSHCNKYDCLTSTFREISAGIIQGSGIGPASYVVNSSDLEDVTRQGIYCANMLTTLT